MEGRGRGESEITKEVGKRTESGRGKRERAKKRVADDKGGRKKGIERGRGRGRK